MQAQMQVVRIKKKSSWVVVILVGSSITAEQHAGAIHAFIRPFNQSSIHRGGVEEA